MWAIYDMVEKRIVSMRKVKDQIFFTQRSIVIKICAIALDGGIPPIKIRIDQITNFLSSRDLALPVRMIF